MNQSFSFITYDKFTGEINATGNAGAFDDLSWLEDGEYIMEGTANWRTQYIDVANEDVIARQSQIATIDKATVLADGVDFATVSSIEANAEILINGIYHGINLDTELEITFDTIGEHTVMIKKFPYIDIELIINAN